MGRALRGFWMFLLPRAGSLWVLTGVFVLLAVLTGALWGNPSWVPAWVMGTYPILLLLLLFFSASSLGGPLLDLLLSMGRRRRDFWLAGECVLLVLSLVAWLLWCAVMELPHWLGGSYPDQLRLQLDLGGQCSRPLFLLACLTAPSAGAAVGALSSDSRILGDAAAAAALFITLVSAFGIYLFSISGGVDHGSTLPGALCLFFGAIWLSGQVMWSRSVGRRTI